MGFHSLFQEMGKYTNPMAWGSNRYLVLGKYNLTQVSDTRKQGFDLILQEMGNNNSGLHNTSRSGLSSLNPKASSK